MTAVDFGQSGAMLVAQVLEVRGEQLAQQWAELPLFRTVYTSGRDAAVGAAHHLVGTLADVARSERVEDSTAPDFDRIRPHLAQMIAARTRGGCSSPQLAAEVAELKKPLMAIVGQELADQDGGAGRLAAVELMGTLRVVIMEITLSEGAEIIDRQRQQLLEAIVDQHAAVAILDITGVPLVDTAVAQYLMKTAMAVRLMGAECVVSGIRPQIAQTIVQLGIDLGDITTRATLADALAWALEKAGVTVTGQV